MATRVIERSAESQGVARARDLKLGDSSYTSSSLSPDVSDGEH